MGMFDDLIPAETPKGNSGGMFDDLIPPERSFTEKLGNFFRNVYENPPPSVAAARDIIKGAPAAATELTYGADPEAARGAAGTMAGAAALGLGFKGPGGTNVGVLGRPIAKPGTVSMPTPGPIFAREAGPASSVSQEAVEAAARGGYTLPGYVATEGTVIPQVAASVKNVPWAGQPITRTHDELLANMGRSASEIAPGAGTVETAGQAAKSGLTDYIKTGSKGEVREAYQAVDALINPDVRVPLDNTRAAVAELMAKRTNARIPGRSKAVDLVFDAVQDPRGMNYTGTKDIRSYLGEKSNFQLAAEGINPAESKLLYGALSKDLARTVTEAGGPEAYSAWRKANVLAQVAKGEQKKLTKIVGAAGDAGPEAVFNKLITFANSKAGADVSRLRLARRAMGPDAWSEIAPVIIDRLGRAAGEDFSPGRFVTAWNNMSRAAKNELFSGPQRAALEDLFLVSKHIGDRITRFGNPSGTARGSIIGQGITGGALFTDPVSTITTLVGARLAAEALSRPAVVRAATAASRAQLAGNPMRTQRALAALRAAVAAEGLAARQPPGYAEGGRPPVGQLALVGEEGPEVFVPDDPWARAAARTGRRGRQEGAGTKFIEGGYGIPAAYRALDRGAQEAFESAGSLQRGGSYDPAPVVQQAIGAVGAPLVGPAMKGAVLGSGAVRPIRAYHGSPYDFERFDLSKIGTGEGAQVYGHGLYFAENPAVAQSYKDAMRVTDMNWPVKGTEYDLPAWVARTAQNSPRALEEVRQNFLGRVEEARRELAAGDHNASSRLYHTQRVVDALDAVKSGAELQKPGKMYEVNIHAKPEQFLDWDKPLAAQPPEIFDTVKRGLSKRMIDTTDQMRGADVVREMQTHYGGLWRRPDETRAMAPADASLALQRAGIPGIKYLDQGSRGVENWVLRHPQGGTFEYPTEQAAKQFLAKNPEYSLEAPKRTSNFVLFRDDIIDIVKKYGLAGAATMLGISRDEARAAMSRPSPKEAAP